MASGQVLAISVIALLFGVGSIVLVLRPATSGAGGGCSVVCVTSLNSLTGALTLTHFTSLNMTTVGNTITYGINLANPNTWTATQIFNAQIQSSGSNDLSLIAATGRNIFLQGVNVEPSTDNTAYLGSTNLRWTDVSVANGFVVFKNAGDTQPVSNFGSGILAFGAGGSSATDMSIGRSAGGNMIFQMGSTEIFRLTTSLAFQFSTASILLKTNPTYILSGSTNIFGLSSTGIQNTQGFQSIIAQTLTNPSTSTVVTLPVAEPDTSYAAVCTGNFAGVLSISNKMTNQFTVNYPAIAIGTDTVDCIVTHQ